MSDFYRTPMGQRFFQKTMPDIANALSSIAKSLSQPSDTIVSDKEIHYKELLNNVINAISNHESNQTTIKNLLYLGFTEEDLVQEFNFTDSDVKDAAEDMDDFEPDI